MHELQVGLTPEQIARRREGLGGSDAKVIMTGTEAALLALWEEKTGRRESDDLSGVLPVQFGVVTEHLNICWYERETGREVTDDGWSGAREGWPAWLFNLDGLTSTVTGETAIFEAKCVNAFSDPDDVAQRYMAQLHHYMAGVGVEWAVLSVFIGTLKWMFWDIPLDRDYLAILEEREDIFWQHVQNDTPPVALEPVEPPKAPGKMREVDMDGNNLWASCAEDWLANKDAVKTFDGAVKDIKSLVESDVSRATGYGIVAKRSKNGAIRISEYGDA